MNAIKGYKSIIFAVILTLTGIACVSTDADAWHRYWGGGWGHGYYAPGWHHGGWVYRSWGYAVGPTVVYYGYGARCNFVPAHRNMYGHWIPAHRNCW